MSPQTHCWASAADIAWTSLTLPPNSATPCKTSPQSTVSITNCGKNNPHPGSDIHKKNPTAAAVGFFDAAMINSWFCHSKDQGAQSPVGLRLPGPSECFANKIYRQTAAPNRVPFAGTVCVSQNRLLFIPGGLSRLYKNMLVKKKHIAYNNLVGGLATDWQRVVVHPALPIPLGWTSGSASYIFLLQTLKV